MGCQHCRQRLETKESLPRPLRLPHFCDARVQLPANVLGKIAKDGLSAWAPAPIWQFQAPGFGLAWPSPGCCSSICGSEPTVSVTAFRVNPYIFLCKEKKEDLVGDRHLRDYRLLLSRRFLGIKRILSKALPGLSLDRSLWMWSRRGRREGGREVGR